MSEDQKHNDFVINYAKVTWDYWDADQDHKVGKRLMAMSKECPGYAPQLENAQKQLQGASKFVWRMTILHLEYLAHYGTVGRPLLEQDLAFAREFTGIPIPSFYENTREESEIAKVAKDMLEKLGF